MDMPKMEMAGMPALPEMKMPALPEMKMPDMMAMPAFSPPGLPSWLGGPSPVPPRLHVRVLAHRQTQRCGDYAPG
jgi:hypothetical protein